MKLEHSQSSSKCKKFYSYLLISLTLLLPALDLPGSEILKPEKQHGLSGQIIAKLLSRYHYNHMKIDDAVSSETLDLYIENLDPNKMYFLASDIAKFEKYRYVFDDHIKSGNVDAAYLIFNNRTERVYERIDYVMRRLEQPFDFTINELFKHDREYANWAQTTQELDELWRHRIKHEALDLKLAGKDWPGIQKTLKSKYSNFKRRVNQNNSEDVFKAYINSLSETFDPHTSYFSPISAENFGIDMSLSLEGIGAQLTTEDEYTKVVRIIAGGPADRSKQIWANDKIVGVAQDINGEMLDVVGMRLDDVVQKIRGKKGSIVRLELIPANSPAGSGTKEITLVRDKIILQEKAAKSDTVDFFHEGVNYKLGIITIPSFYIDFEGQKRKDPNYKSTTRDVRRIIKELQGAEVDGIVIDLRRNGGGSLQEAIELTGLFIDEGPVVQVKDLRGSKRIEYDPDPALDYDGPLAVIVDRFSASASEIFSAAIQDYGRGIILGGQTFGKGTVQNLLHLDRFINSDTEKFGQLKVTIAKFYRITGGTTQHRGVIPDVSFPSIYNYWDGIGENKQLHALPWDEISPAMFKLHDQVSRYVAELRLNSNKRTAKDREFQYIVEDIERHQEEKEKGSVSLKESDRKALRIISEDRQFERLNERRIARGLKPIKKGEEIKETEKSDPDPWLDESQEILVDLIALSNSSAMRLTKTNPEKQKAKGKRSETVGSSNQN